MPESLIKTVIAWKLDDLIVPLHRSTIGWEKLLRAHLEGTARQLVWNGRLLVKPTDEELIELLEAGVLKFNGKRVQVDADSIVDHQLFRNDVIEPDLCHTNDARAFVRQYKKSFYSVQDHALFHVPHSAMSYILNADDFLRDHQSDPFFFAPLGSIVDFFQMFIAWSTEFDVIHSLHLSLDGSVSPETLRELLDAFCLILIHSGMDASQIPSAFTAQFWLEQNHLRLYQDQCATKYGSLSAQSVPAHFSDLIVALVNKRKYSEEALVQVESDFTSLNRKEIVEAISARIDRNELSAAHHQKIFAALKQAHNDRLFYAEKFYETYAQKGYFFRIIISAHAEWSLKVSNRHIMHKAFYFEINSQAQLDCFMPRFFALIAVLEKVNILDFFGYCLKVAALKPNQSVMRNMLTMGLEQQWLQAFKDIFSNHFLPAHNKALRAIINSPHFSLNKPFFLPEASMIMAHMATLSAILTMMMGNREKYEADFIETLPEDFLFLLRHALNAGREKPVVEVVQKKLAERFILLWICTVFVEVSTVSYAKAFVDFLLRSVFDKVPQYQHVRAKNAYLLDMCSAGLLARINRLSASEPSVRRAASDDGLSSPRFTAWSAVYPMVRALLEAQDAPYYQETYPMSSDQYYSGDFERRIRCVLEPFNQPNQCTKIFTREEAGHKINVLAVLRLTFSNVPDVARQVNAASIKAIKTWQMNSDGVYAQNAKPDFNRPIFSIQFIGEDLMELTWYAKSRQFYFDTTDLRQGVDRRADAGLKISFIVPANPQGLLSLEIMQQLSSLQEGCSDHMSDASSQALWLSLYLNHMQFVAQETALLQVVPTDNSLLRLIFDFLNIQKQPSSDAAGAPLEKWLNRYGNNLSKHWWALTGAFIVFSAIAAIVAYYFMPSTFSYDGFDVDLFAHSEKNLKIARLIVIILNISPYALYAAAFQVIVFISLNMYRARRLGKKMLENKSLYEVVLASVAGTVGRTDQLSSALQASLQISEHDTAADAQLRQKVQKMQRLLADLTDCAKNGGVLPEIKGILLQTASNQEFLEQVRTQSVELIRDYTRTTRLEHRQDTRETKINIAIIILAIVAIAGPQVLNYFFKNSLEDAKVKEYLGKFLVGTLLSAASMAGLSASMILIGLIASTMYLIDYLLNHVHYPKLSQCWHGCLTLFSRHRGYARLLQDDDAQALQLSISA